MQMTIQKLIDKSILINVLDKFMKHLNLLGMGLGMAWWVKYL